MITNAKQWQKCLILIKNNMVNIFFFIVIVILFLGSTLFANYIYKLQFASSYNNTPYNGNAITFIMKSDGKSSINLNELIGTDVLNKCVLFQVDSDGESGYHVVYCSENAVDLQDSQTWDWNYMSGDKAAAVGIDTSYNIGDVIEINGREYHVRGKLARHISDAVNYGIFYTDSKLDAVSANQRYILTSKSGSNVKKAFDVLENTLQSNDIRVKKLDVRNAEFKDYIRYDSTIKVILVLVCIFYALLVMIIGKLCTKSKSAEIEVRKILGDKNIILKGYLKYVLLWITAYVFNTIVVLLAMDSLYLEIYAYIVITLAIMVMAVLTGALNFLWIRKSCGKI